MKIIERVLFSLHVHVALQILAPRKDHLKALAPSLPFQNTLVEARADQSRELLPAKKQWKT